MKRCAILALSAVLLLPACTEINNEGVGGAAGGIVGGLLGSQFGAGSGRVAAAAGGALVGAFLGSRIGRTMDEVDQLKMQKALETAPTGRAVSWQNPDSGNSYTVQPKRTYYVQNQPCREYTTRALIGGKSQEIYGKACRKPGGAWRIVR